MVNAQIYSLYTSFIWLTYLSTFTVQFKMVSLCLEKPMYALHLSLRSFPNSSNVHLIYLHKSNFFLAWSVSSWGQCWFALSKWRAENGRFMMYLTHAKHVTIVYDIVYTYCWAQNGSTQGHGFVTFKHWFLTNRMRNWVKTFCESVFYLTLPRMLLWLSSPLMRHYDLKV